MSFQALDPENDRQEQLKRVSEAAALEASPRLKRPAEDFETNPQNLGLEPEAEPIDWLQQSESMRVREAVRQMVQEGRFVNDIARDLALSPASIVRWETNYRNFLSKLQPTGTPNWEINTSWSGHEAIPLEWKTHFAQNWEQLVKITQAKEDDFKQDPLEIFLHTSWLTSWLFREGKFDKNVAVGAICALSLGLAVSSFMKYRQGQDLLQGTIRTLGQTQEQIDQREIALAIPVARQFFEEATWEKKLAFVRQPESMLASLQSWFSEHNHDNYAGSNVELASHEPGIVHLLVGFKDDRVPHAFLALVKENDRYLLDWESSSIFQKTKWEEIKKTRSIEKQPLMCVVKKADYYNYQFNSDKHWSCYELSYPNGNITLYGYTPIHSDTDITLSTQLNFCEYVSVVINISFPPETVSDNQVQLHEIIRHGWLQHWFESEQQKQTTTLAQ